MSKRIFIGLWLGWLAVCGLSLFIIFLPPFEISRSLVNHIAKDGNLEMFSQAFFHFARIPGLICAGLCWAAVVWSLMKMELALAWADEWFRLPGKLCRRLRDDWRIFSGDIHALRITRRECAFIIVLALFAIVLRVPFLMRAMDHDEAYTVVAFASAPLKEGLSDYHHPNNHLFHTLLVHFVIQLFDPARMIAPPWVVRLPAFFAGVFLVPVVYLFARRLYGGVAAALAGLFTASMPALIYFSANARGYSLIMLFTLLIMLTAGYVRRRKSLVGWGLLIIISVLGFYTIPIFLYSYAVMLAWFFLSGWIRLDGAEYRSPGDLLKWLLVSGIITVFLSLLVYAPVFIRYQGMGILFRDVSIIPTWADFIDMMHSRFSDNVEQWLLDLPPAAGYLALAGVVLSILLPPEGQAWTNPLKAVKTARMSALLVLVSVVFSLAILTIALRPNLYPRFVSFLIPFLIIWVAAGWAAFIKMVAKLLNAPRAFLALAVILITAGVVLGSGLRITRYAKMRYFQQGSVEAASLFLKQTLREMDLVVVEPPHDAVLWYYSRLHGMSMEHYKRELPFFRAFVLVDPGVNETLESVLVERGPELFFFDLPQARIVFQSGSVMLYECVPDADLIRKEYGLD